MASVSSQQHLLSITV